jgi:hypothetical protein
VRRLTSGEGKVGKEVQELTADLGKVPRAAVVFRRPECRKAKGNWSGSFGVEMWC